MPDRTLGIIVDERAARAPEDAFLYFESTTRTNRDMAVGARRVANGLLAAGYQPGDHIAVMYPNTPTFCDWWFGIAMMGGVMVPVNTALRGEQLRYTVDHSDSRALFIPAAYHDAVDAVRADIPQVENIIIDMQEGADGGPAPEGCTALEEFLGGTEPVACDRSFEDLAVIMYTSGTTGLPKGVMLKHNAYAGAGLGGQNPDALGRSAFGFAKGRTLFTCLPLFHANAQIVTFVNALLADTKVHLSRRFSASRIWDELRAHDSIMFTTLGAMIPIMLKQPEKPDDADNPVKFVVSAACPKECWKPFEKRFGVTILEGYGTTEGGGLLNIAGGPPGSMGKAAPWVEVRIVDANDNDVPDGEVGELISRPKNTTVKFIEYYKNPEATAAKRKGGWLRSGDLVRRDETGWIYFVDRQSEAMRRRGENIATFEVETIINQCPGVAENAVYGVPSELGEDDVMTAVIRAPDDAGTNLTAETLMDFLQGKLAYFAMPRYVRFVDELPKTETERYQKYKLKHEGVTADTWDREKAGYEVER